MKDLTVSEALIALGNGEKIACDDFGGELPFIHLVKDEIVWGDGKRYKGTISTSLDCSNIRIYQEFTYPMWFEQLGSGNLYLYKSLNSCTHIESGEDFSHTLPHTDESMKQIEEPKTINLDDITPLEEPTCSGEFDGGNIVANEEAYDALVKEGYQAYAFTNSEEVEGCFYEVFNGKFGTTENEGDLDKGTKPFYINKGKLSWDKPTEEPFKVTEKQDTISIVDEKKANFAEYGFEAPEFECVLFYRDANDMCVGVVKNDYSFNGDDEPPEICHFWDDDGKSYEVEKFGECNAKPIYNLKPISKPWYENKDNFPALIVYGDEDDESIAVAHSYQSDNNMLWDEAVNAIISVDRCRLANETDRDSLHFKKG